MNRKIALVLAFFGLSGSAWAFNGDLSTSNYNKCYNGSVIPNSLCFEKDYTGETVVDGHPMSARVHARLISGPTDTHSPYRTMKVALQISSLDDSADLFHADGSLAVQARATLGSYHRSWSFWTQGQAVALPRIYGSRQFVGYGEITFTLQAYDGGEDSQTLTQLELVFPGRQTSLIVPF